MQLVKTGVAGTMESSDIMIRIEPRNDGGVTVDLQSSVMQQFGKQIERVICDTLGELGVENAAVFAVDKGALDCTVRARTGAAVYRGAESDAYAWRTKA